MKKLGFILIGLHYFIFANSQQKISIPEYLALVRDRQENKIYQERLDFITGQPSVLPFIEKVELRTETNQLNSFKLDYALRVSTNGLREIEHQRQIYSDEVRQVQLDKQVVLQNTLLEHYKLLIDLIYLPRLYDLNRELSIVVEDRISVLEQLLQNNFGPDVSDLIEAEYDRSQLELDLLELGNLLNQNIEHIKELTSNSDSIAIDTTNLISIETMIFTSQMNLDIGTRENVYYAAKSNAIQMAQNQVLAEQLKSQNPISYVQVGYDGGRNDPFAETFSVGLGIKLPWKGSAKVKVRENSMKELEARQELAMFLLESENQRRELVKGFEAIYLKYFLLKKQEEEDKARKILEQYLQVDGISPITLLKLNENILERKIQMVTLQYQIYHRYVELHDVLGKLAQEPLRNYLSEDLDRF